MIDCTLVKKTLLVLNGSPPSEELLSWRFEDSDQAVAVDGGWYAFQHAGLIPAALIGDFDSCSEYEKIRDQFPGVSVVFDNEQDTTDFQKGIKWIEENTKTDELIILGGFRGRSDHFISNLFNAMKINSSWVVVFDDRIEWIRRVTPSTPLKLSGCKGKSLSVLSFVECNGVSSTGLKWELENDRLSPIEKFSQSNLCVRNEVEISTSRGTLLVIIPKGV